MPDGMTIAELAEQVGLSARNIRSYQSRGLLSPPRIDGRVAYYSGAHVARLALIGSLQREGFTLPAITRLLATPGDYSAIVALRRQQLRDGESDISATVPVSEDSIRELFPGLPEDLTETGLVWRDDAGRLVSGTALVGIARSLLELGLPADVLTELQLHAVRAGSENGDLLLRHRVEPDAGDPGEPPDPHVVRLVAQLASVAFEIGFLASADPAASPR